MTEQRRLSDSQLEKLLTVFGTEIDYPTAPDIATEVECLVSQPPFHQPAEEDLLQQAGSSSFQDAFTLRSDQLPAYIELPGRSRTRELLVLAAGLLVFILVGGALTLVFRGFSTGNDETLTGSGAMATAPHYLYVVSDVYGVEENASVYVSGRLRALDPDTGKEAYAIELDSEADAVLSSDGTRLYVASQFDLIAFDAATGNELWRTKIENRVRRILGLGPSTIAISQDGSQLYVYSRDKSGIYDDVNLIPYWIEVFDTAQGDLIGQYEAPYCQAKISLSPDGNTLYIFCLDQGTGRSRAVDLDSGEPVADWTVSDYQLGGFRSAIESADGTLLYAVSTSKVTVFDLDAREVVDQRDLELDSEPTFLLWLVAVSPDNSRLFIGLATDIEPNSNMELSRKIAVFDTETWQRVGQITTDILITGQTLAAAPDNQSVYASHTDLRSRSSIPIESVLLKLSMDSTTQEILELGREEIRQIIEPPSDVHNP